jgi:hypothetical protein
MTDVILRIFHVYTVSAIKYEMNKIAMEEKN